MAWYPSRPDQKGTSVTDAADTNYNRTLAYDDLDRLVTATSPAWGTGSLAYNGWGNLLTQNLGSALALTYSYDTANRLASVSGTEAYSFSYDVYGNVVDNGRSTSSGSTSLDRKRGVVKC